MKQDLINFIQKNSINHSERSCNIITIFHNSDINYKIASAILIRTLENIQLYTSRFYRGKSYQQIITQIFIRKVQKAYRLNHLLSL